MFQVSHLAAILTDLESLIEKKLSYKCQGSEAEISCHQRKIDLEVKIFFLNFFFLKYLSYFQVELHQTKLAVEQAEKRLKQVETESKQRLDRLQELRSKVGEGWPLCWLAKIEMQNV